MANLKRPRRGDLQHGYWARMAAERRTVRRQSAGVVGTLTWVGSGGRAVVIVGGRRQHVLTRDLVVIHPT